MKLTMMRVRVTKSQVSKRMIMEMRKKRRKMMRMRMRTETRRCSAPKKARGRCTKRYTGS
jgi:hypothetical protein